MINQSEQATAALLKLIERGELAPGSMISERSLMERSGFGRTPVREAVQRLALTHMLLIHPNKGIEIAPMSVEDQLSGLEVRRPVESLAVTLACKRAKVEELAAIEELAHSLDASFSLIGYTETIRQTHRLVIRAAHNLYLEALLTPLQALSRRFWLLNLGDAEREIETGKILHQRMLVAIACRDSAAAVLASTQLNDYLREFALDIIASKFKV